MANVAVKNKQYKNKKSKKQAKMKQTVLAKHKNVTTTTTTTKKDNLKYHPYTVEEIEEKNKPEINDLSALDSENKTFVNDYFRHASVLLWMSSLVTMFLLGFWNQFDYKKIMYGLILIVILDGVLITYVQLQETKIFQKKHSWYMFSIGYTMTLILICNPVHLEDYLFWIGGAMLIAYYVDLNVSLLTMFGLLTITGVLGQTSLTDVLFQVLLGSILCCMVRFLKKWSHLAYIIILAVSLEVTLLFVSNSFDLTITLQEDNVVSICYLIALLVVFYIFINIIPADSIHKKMLPSKETSFVIEKVRQAVSEAAATTQVLLLDENKTTKEQQEEKTLKTIISPEFPLLTELQTVSNRLYEHSKTVADICMRAAIQINANQELVAAGAWYHEIGRLRGKDYVNNGIELAKEYELPESVISLIRQHNFKVELPHSTEAAILMLTDNIISTIQYLKVNNDTQITPEKVIENTFAVRLNKGTLDESGLTLEQFNTLKAFFMSIVEEFR